MKPLLAGCLSFFDSLPPQLFSHFLTKSPVAWAVSNDGVASGARMHGVIGHVSCTPSHPNTWPTTAGHVQVNIAGG